MTAPMLLLLLMGLYDVTTGWLAWQRVARSAQAIAEIATVLAANVDGTNSLTSDQAWRASTAIYAVMPELKSAAPGQYGVVLSAVTFTPAGCTSNCAANTSWSALQVGQAALRPCGALAVAPDTAGPSQASLPVDLFQSYPVLVVDVTYVFTPLFLNVVVGQIPMMRSAYVPSRTGTLHQAITYSQPAAQCS